MMNAMTSATTFIELYDPEKWNAERTTPIAAFAADTIAPYIAKVFTVPMNFLSFIKESIANAGLGVEGTGATGGVCGATGGVTGV